MTPSLFFSHSQRTKRRCINTPDEATGKTLIQFFGRAREARPKKVDEVGWKVTKYYYVAVFHTVELATEPNYRNVPEVIS